MTKQKRSRIKGAKRPLGVHSFAYHGSEIGRMAPTLLKTTAAHLLSTGGPGNPVGTTAQNFNPLEILYHRLQVNVQPLSFNFLDGSGIYRYPNDPNHAVDIGSFIQAWVDGVLPDADSLSWDSSLYNMGTGGAPNILVKKQCYVVVELNGPTGMRIRADSPAIDIQDSDSEDHYCYLTHVDATGEEYPVKTADTPLQLFYFGVEDPDINRGDDQFNLYLQIDSASSLTLLTIDPCIKNRGGPDLTSNSRKQKKSSDPK